MLEHHPQLVFLISLSILSLATSALSAADPFPPGWTTRSPRDEIRPAFSYDPKGGPKNTGSLVITHDQRNGLDGWFQQSYPVTGGDTYRFQALRKCTGVTIPRRSALVRIIWQDANGKMVPPDVTEAEKGDPRVIWNAEPEHPSDSATDADAQGWTTVGGVYRAPSKATQAILELHLQWAPGGRVDWSEITFAKTAPQQPRKVRLATVHYMPKGKSPRENCQEYAPLIAEAARQKADLVVLGETVTMVNAKKTPVDVAEPIPGPTTDYFSSLARQYQTHIVVSLNEREGHLVYNAAVLLGPGGKLIGKYRKMCMPHSEAEAGVMPGNDCPVFDTSFGKVGMMICYDGFFPEVARELTNRGAEVIAWPVWGCNPLLAKARACENHVYLISSTYMNPKDGWMISAIFNPGGNPIATADTFGTIAVAEVDLNQPYIGPFNLGDFHAMLPRHRPVQVAEPGLSH